jgi:nucleotide-binding universal stress UspA family protein
MESFKRILVPRIEERGWERALRTASVLAIASGAQVTLADLPDARRSARDTDFGSALRGLRSCGVDATSAVLAGEPGVGIARAVMERRYDLVVVAESRFGLLQEILGHADPIRVLRECPCPVWVVRPESLSVPRRVAAAVAGAEDAREGDRQIVRIARDVARLTGSRLDIVHAWEYAGNDYETSRSELLPEMARALRDHTVARAEQAVRSVLEECDIGEGDVTIQLRHGRPDAGLAEFAYQNSVDLVVMGMAGRRGLSALVFGERIDLLRPRLRCSLLVVKRPSFVPAVETARAHGTAPVPQRIGATSATFSERIR